MHPLRRALAALRRSLAARVFFAVFLIYAFYAQDGWNANSNRYTALAHAIVLEHRFAITTWHAATVDTSYAHGEYYAGAAPGPAIVLVPFYAAFRVAWPLVPEGLRAKVGRAAEARLAVVEPGVTRDFDVAEFVLSAQALALTVPPLAGAALATLLFVFFRRRLPERDALLLTLAVAFGTLVFHYSTVVFSHVLAALCALGSLVILDPGAGDAEATEISARRALLAGALAGFATTMDYLAVSASLVLAFLALARLPLRSRLPLFAAGAIGVALLLALYQKAAFGSIAATPYSFPSGPHDDGTHDVVQSGFFGMDRPRPRVIWELTFGLRRGYFVYMPALLIGVAGLAASLIDRRKDAALPRGLAAACLAVPVALLLFNASMKKEVFWLSGISFGPRYLIPSIPFAAAGLAAAWRWGRGGRIAIAALGAIGIAINWLGAQFGAADHAAASPITDHLLPAFVQRGPQSSLVNGLLAVTGAGRGVGLAIELVGMAIVAALVTRLLLRRAPAPAAQAQ